MQLNDAVPERRNLIVFCLTTIIFFVGGGNACGDIKLPIVGVLLTNKNGLIAIYWLIFIYLVFRYFLIFKETEYKENAGRYQSVKTYRSAIRMAFTFTVKPKKLVNLLKWGVTKGGGEERRKLAQKLREIGVDETKDIPAGAVDFDFDGPDNNGEISTFIRINNGSDKDKLLSESINPLGFKFFFITLYYFTKNLLTNKYLSDWILPWYMVFCTLCLILGFWFFGEYQLCSV